MLKKILDTLSTNVLIFIINFIISIFIARALGPQGQGEITFVLLIPNTMYMFLSINYFGDNIYFLRKKIFSNESIFSASVIFFFILSSLEIFAVSIYGIFNIVSNFVFIIIFIITFNLNNFIVSYLFGIGKIIFRNRVMFGQSFIYFIFIIILYYGNKQYLNVTNILVIQCLLNIFSSIICFFIIKKSFNCKVEFAFKQSMKIIRTTLSISRLNYISNLANFLNYRLDQWIIVFLLGKPDLGIYSIAVNIAEKFWIIPDSIASVIYPEIVGKDNNELKRIIKKIDRIIVQSILLGTIAWIISLFIFDKLVLMVYGDRYFSVSKIFKILFPSIVLFAIVKVIAGFFAGLGRPDIRVKASIISTVVNGGLNLILIRRYGISGAAISSTVSYALYSIIILHKYMIVRKQPESFKDTIVNNLICK
ncbi:polysaccharide biosynthesis C-terminal domain-containing protein [Clostridium sp. A1-XYC3]|uniref:Polysaccharide biosynthesis C-terminal domain-containing protein n=1 Tax=Clostridium tanneri TaxID=3037988 RepID=A0ABU4JVL8_9CLOT|nr:polysaccharide biosynthesis C-terminal domain-containing protein [Clostridium sp. A1-XYC3]MDW8802194.1 polysaccharide biosynthesis C-terminal domain-containing protein [Clostridium sp. A1-XYC3]